MLIKICGNTQPENLFQIESLNPDLVGVIFYPRSLRFVADQLDAYVFSDATVAVFVNESTDQILKICHQLNISRVQLHGNETKQECQFLKKNGMIVYKAFGINSADDLVICEQYHDVTDYFIFDTKTASYGGSGESFNWQILKDYSGKTPFFLSGGLGPENIDSALELRLPGLIGFDLNSKIEIKPGIKDITTTKRIIEKIRDHE